MRSELFPPRTRIRVISWGQFPANEKLRAPDLQRAPAASVLKSSPYSWDLVFAAAGLCLASSPSLPRRPHRPRGGPSDHAHRGVSVHPPGSHWQGDVARPEPIRVTASRRRAGLLVPRDGPRRYSSDTNSAHPPAPRELGSTPRTALPSTHHFHRAQMKRNVPARGDLASLLER